MLWLVLASSETGEVGADLIMWWHHLRFGVEIVVVWVFFCLGTKGVYHVCSVSHFCSKTSFCVELLLVTLIIINQTVMALWSRLTVGFLIEDHLCLYRSLVGCHKLDNGFSHTFLQRWHNTKAKCGLALRDYWNSHILKQWLFIPVSFTYFRVLAQQSKCTHTGQTGHTH